MLKNKCLLFFAFFLVIVPLAYAADDQYKSYLHKPVVPEHPKAKLYGKYQTNLFPGAGTYTYPIEVPKGTNDLQPALSISYNSQAVKQRPSFLGAGWTLTQNYVYRDVNFTPSNTTDDEFKLILNDASYGLIYDGADGFYHTEIETFARIQNLSNASNNYGMYWLVTLKDGTQLKFGYHADSELTSNTGYSYALKWSLDQIEDTHNNRISYSYNENPYAQDNGSVYLTQILYNNDQKRKIEFGYEDSNRLDIRRVYEQGNVLEESRRLSDVNVFFNSTLVRRYNFGFNNLNNESSLSSLSKIRYIGSDNSSVLHTITFGYYQSTSFYANSTTYNSSVLFSNSAGEDFGVRLVDLNNDGYVDMIQGKGATSEKKAWLNNKTGWNESNSFAPPEFFVYNSGPQVGLDRGLRVADINNDGLADLIQGWGGTRKAWLNNATGWREDSATWAPSIDFASSSGVDEGVQLVDFDGDGKADILQAKESGPVKKAYLNTGNGWKDVSSQWNSPTYFVKSDGSDFGSRLVEINGDGLIDVIEGYNFGTLTKNAWLNNGSGWVRSAVWDPPDVFTSSSRVDNGMRFVDLNGDGLTDIFQDYKNGSITERETFINNGNGWTNTSYWISPEPFTKDGRNTGRRIGDVNGDGLGDVIIGYNDGSNVNRTLIRNSTIPYLLKNITNEYGGATYLDYSKSTLFSNTGEDGISDIGFNVWVVSNATQDNSLPSDFNVLGNASYHYFGGKYDYNDSEFRGFSIVNETLADKSVTSHYFHQTKQLKGKEYGTETYDSSGNIFQKIESSYNFTTTNYGYFIVNFLSTASYTYDGNPLNPKIINTSYKYDNYGNILSKTSFGDISITGDEKFENYTFAYNTTSWILDKPSWYISFDSSLNKIRETKHFYDNHQYGDPPSKGDLTKVENWLDTGGGNPTTYYQYDDFGNLYRETDVLGRATTRDYGIRDDTHTYPDRITNALGHAIDYVYDVGTGNVISYKNHGVDFLYEYDTFGRISKDIDPYDTSDLPTKSYTYNYDGVAPEIIKVSQKTTSNKTIDNYFVYDGFANLVQIKSPADNGQQVVKNLFYDGLFRVKEEQNPYFETSSTSLSNKSNTTNTTKYNYDALSRVISVVNPDGTFINTTYNKSTIDDYDANRNRHTYVLDAYDRITEVREYNTDYYIGDNQTYNTSYTYDASDQLIGIRDNYGNNINLTFDSLNRKIKLLHPDLGTWNYEYDTANNLIRRSNSKGDVVALGYDGLNRILQKNTTNQTITLFYDKQHQGTLTNVSYISDITNFNNYSITYLYDDRLRIIKETIYEGGEVDTTSNTYDSMDRIIESLQPNNVELDIYYNAQNKIDKIKGYINQTRYNVVGNPLNRTYFNGKITTFDYNPTNLRLKQIKTNNIQQLNYSYDNVGNVISINDSVNNRSYKMGYDNLNRLTNVTINNFNWVYSYDAIGNILKIARNYSQTTSFKYEGLAHAFTKVITKDTGIDVYRPSVYNGTNRTQIVQFYLVNEKNTSISQVNYTVEFGDGSSTTGNNINLAFKGFNLVTVERNYSKGGNYRVNITGRANTTATDYQPLRLLFGTLANSLSILKKNATTVITEFMAQNTIAADSNSWGWNCSNGVFSTINFNMSSSQSLMIIMEHNFTLNGGVNLSCKVNSTDGNQTLLLPFTFDGIKIEGYNSTKVDTDTVSVKFQIKNYFSTLSGISWNITANGLKYNASGITLTQSQSTTISQEINLTSGGLKYIKITIGQGNFTDSYAEYYKVDWLGISQFFSTLKNATARVYDFLITNYNNVNTLTLWNFTSPTLNHSLNLTNNESLIVVIEEDYSQGNKEATIQVFNQTIGEDNLIEVFRIRQIGINSLQTLHENGSRAVVSSIVVNNIKPLNLSWKLNNSEQLILSTQNLYLNTSEQAIVVIESNFSTSGIYPLIFQINSSTYNDNQTGVAVS